MELILIPLSSTVLENLTVTGSIINTYLQDQIANTQLTPGPQGLVGATGPIGAQSATGPPGAQGPPGAALVCAPRRRRRATTTSTTPSPGWPQDNLSAPAFSAVRRRRRTSEAGLRGSRLGQRRQSWQQQRPKQRKSRKEIQWGRLAFNPDSVFKNLIGLKKRLIGHFGALLYPVPKIEMLA